MNLQLSALLRDRPIVLASTSPRRRELLSSLGLDFEIRAPDYEEDMSVDCEPGLLAESLALGKAESLEVDDGSIVVAGDTFVAIGSRLLGKPGIAEAARQHLLEIEGRTHTIHSGWAVVSRSGAVVSSGVVSSSVTIRPMTVHEVDAYVATGEPLDKAGGYALQGIGSVFVERVEGSISAVIGLPLPEVYDALLFHAES